MQIKLKAVKISTKILKYLEKKGLISVLKPTDKALKTKTGTVDIYCIHQIKNPVHTG